MVKLTIASIEEKHGTRGAYWRLDTTQGWLSCFDKDLAAIFKDSIGVELDVEIKEKGNFKNAVGLATYPLVKPKQPESKAIVRKASDKDAMMCTSYVKDLVISGKSVEDAIKIIKQAKEAFSNE